MSCYRFIGYCCDSWPVHVLCHMPGTSYPGYYQWRGRAQPTAAP
ncbi:hypothetical protein [Hymenobacter rubidus]|nr:hypothetical protein [Hymenobacter rubidus]